MAKLKDRKAQLDWDEFVQNMNRDAPVDLNETVPEKRKRIAKLEKDHEAWFKYYFSSFYTSEPTDFHKRSTRRIMRNPEWYEVRAWSRELSKSGRTMMEVLKLVLTGQKKNVILTSNSESNAERLLAPYKSMLEKNERIIHDYGKQERHGRWSSTEFITRNGVAFRGLGKGQSPRGTRNDAIRPDVLIVDDFDTDDDCRNPDILDKHWDWLENALYPTRSVSVPLLVIFCGNIIAEDCTILRAMKMSDFSQVINIRDKNGRSTWPQKNTEEMIDRTLKPISYNAQQGEYFNNPIKKGKVFKKLNYKRLPGYRRYKWMIAYTDPSYKAGKKNDFKATALIGRYKDEYHVKFVRCAQTTTAIMLDWQYQILKETGAQVPVYFLIEWPAIDETLKREINAANLKNGITLPLKADERDKPDKFFRIESLLEPLNRNEKLWFDEKLKDSQHMQDMEAQCLAISPTSRAHDDGPDAVEGGVFAVNAKTLADVSKLQVMAGGRVKSSKHH
jgi:hypothetical protein